MNLLLDTCTLLWSWSRPEMLSRRLQGLLRDPHNEVWVSAASAWELATKHRVGRFPHGEHILAEWDERVAREGFRPLAIGFSHALRAGSMPGPHRDPVRPYDCRPGPDRDAPHRDARPGDRRPRRRHDLVTCGAVPTDVEAFRPVRGRSTRR